MEICLESQPVNSDVGSSVGDGRAGHSVDDSQTLVKRFLAYKKRNQSRKNNDGNTSQWQQFLMQDSKALDKTTATTLPRVPSGPISIPRFLEIADNSFERHVSKNVAAEKVITVRHSIVNPVSTDEQIKVAKKEEDKKRFMPPSAVSLPNKMPHVQGSVATSSVECRTSVTKYAATNSANINRRATPRKSLDILRAYNRKHLPAKTAHKPSVTLPVTSGNCDVKSTHVNDPPVESIEQTRTQCNNNTDSSISRRSPRLAVDCVNTDLRQSSGNQRAAIPPHHETVLKSASKLANVEHARKQCMDAAKPHQPCVITDNDGVSTFHSPASRTAAEAYDGLRYDPTHLKRVVEVSSPNTRLTFDAVDIPADSLRKLDMTTSPDIQVGDSYRKESVACQSRVQSELVPSMNTGTTILKDPNHCEIDVGKPPPASSTNRKLQDHSRRSPLQPCIDTNEGKSKPHAKQPGKHCHTARVVPTITVDGGVPQIPSVRPETCKESKLAGLLHSSEPTRVIVDSRCDFIPAVMDKNDVRMAEPSVIPRDMQLATECTRNAPFIANKLDINKSITRCKDEKHGFLTGTFLHVHQSPTAAAVRVIPTCSSLLEPSYNSTSPVQDPCPPYKPTGMCVNDKPEYSVNLGRNDGSLTKLKSTHTVVNENTEERNNEASTPDAPILSASEANLSTFDNIDNWPPTPPPSTANDRHKAIYMPQRMNAAKSHHPYDISDNDNAVTFHSPASSAAAEAHGDYLMYVPLHTQGTVEVSTPNTKESVDAVGIPADSLIKLDVTTLPDVQVGDLYRKESVACHSCVQSVLVNTGKTILKDPNHCKIDIGKPSPAASINRKLQDHSRRCALQACIVSTQAMKSDTNEGKSQPHAKKSGKHCHTARARVAPTITMDGGVPQIPSVRPETCKHAGLLHSSEPTRFIVDSRCDVIPAVMDENDVTMVEPSVIPCDMQLATECTRNAPFIANKLDIKESIVQSKNKKHGMLASTVLHVRQSESATGVRATSTCSTVLPPSNNSTRISIIEMPKSSVDVGQNDSRDANLQSTNIVVKDNTDQQNHLLSSSTDAAIMSTREVTSSTFDDIENWPSTIARHLQSAVNDHHTALYTPQPVDLPRESQSSVKDDIIEICINCDSDSRGLPKGRDCFSNLQMPHTSKSLEASCKNVTFGAGAKLSASETNSGNDRDTNSGGMMTNSKKVHSKLTRFNPESLYGHQQQKQELSCRSHCEPVMPDKPVVINDSKQTLKQLECRSDGSILPHGINKASFTDSGIDAISWYNEIMSSTEDSASRLEESHRVSQRVYRRLRNLTAVKNPRHGNVCSCGILRH